MLTYSIRSRILGGDQILSQYLLGEYSATFLSTLLMFSDTL